MRITLAVALVAISGSSLLAQESSQIGTVVEAAGEMAASSVVISTEDATVVPVVYQSGTVGGAVGGSGSRAIESVVGGSGSRTIEGAVVTEPSSVVSGEVIQSAPVYSEGVPMAEGTVVSDGGAMVTGSPMASSDCGCGNASAAPIAYSSAPAPMESYSSAPVEYAAPVAEPCCNQPRRGFFRRLFGN